MHTIPRRTLLTSLTGSLIGIGALSACSSGDGTADAADGEATGVSDSGADSGSWPRTVTVGEQEITLQEAPRRVVAVSVETGDLALELIGAERVVAVNDSARESESGNQSELAGQVEGTVTGAPSPDPEQILSFEPDLVLLTGRHDDEKSVADSLATSGVPTATFSSGNFMSPDAVIASLTVLGELLGAEQEASTIAAGIEEKVSAVEEQVSDAEESPRALVLFARGGKQMIEQANATTTELIELAGGTSIARDEKWNASPSADPEVIISAAPDVILVQDFHGAGLGPFQELLGSDALSEVPAVAQDRIELVDAMTTSGTAGSRIGEGLEQVAGILHPDLADPES